MKEQKSITAENQYTQKFRLRGDDPILGPGRATIFIKHGATENAHKLRIYDDDGTTIIAERDLDDTVNLFESSVPVTCDAGVPTGGYNANSLITVRQD